ARRSGEAESQAQSDVRRISGGGNSYRNFWQQGETLKNESDCIPTQSRQTVSREPAVLNRQAQPVQRRYWHSLLRELLRDLIDVNHYRSIDRWCASLSLTSERAMHVLSHNRRSRHRPGRRRFNIL